MPRDHRFPSQRPEARRAPCPTCGGPKEPGRGRRHCAACDPTWTPRDRVRREGCRRCGGPKPPGRGRALCELCAVGGALDDGPVRKRRLATRVIVDDFGEARRYRGCPRCWRWLTEPGNYAPRLCAPSGYVLRYDCVCLPCRATENRQRRAAMPPELRRERDRAKRQREARLEAESVERRERRKRQRREASMRSRERDPEAHRRKQRRAYERLKADPERYAEYLEKQRINHRLRQERRGRTVTRSNSTATNAYRRDEGKGASHQTPEPLAQWLDEVIAREVPDLGRPRGSGRKDRSRTVEDLAAELGVPPRRLWSIMHREQRAVSIGVADRMLTRYGRPVVIDPERAAAALEARCQAMGGNGTRLTHYLDLAEQVAPAAGVVIDRVEDLWPELAGAR